MKNHLTDDETVGFWMPGPPDEQTYVRILNHAQQCIACRDRLWGGMLKLRSLTEGIAKIMHKTLDAQPDRDVVPEVLKAQLSSLLEKAMETSLQGIATASGIPAEVAEGITMSERRAAFDLVHLAMDNLRKHPEKTDWSSRDLFGDNRYGAAEHLAKCEQCFHRITMLAGLAHSMSEGAKNLNAPEVDRVALTKLNSWFDALFARVKELKKSKLGTNPLTGAPNSIQSMCN